MFQLGKFSILAKISLYYTECILDLSTALDKSKKMIIFGPLMSSFKMIIVFKDSGVISKSWLEPESQTNIPTKAWSNLCCTKCSNYLKMVDITKSILGITTGFTYKAREKGFA